MNYRPNSAAIERLKAVNFVAVIGPTAAGKTTLLDAVKARNSAIHPVLVTMTRAPRSDEKNDVDNHFRTEQEVLGRIARQEFVQVAPRILGDIYATAPEDYATEGIAVMPVIADAMPTFLALPFKQIRQVIVLPPDAETWQRRISTRNFTPEQKAKRMAEAKRSLLYALDTAEAAYVINRDLENAVDDLESILLGNKPLAAASEGRRVAQELLRTMDV